MLPLLCQHGIERRWRHVFFGSTPATLQALASRLSRACPGIIVADLISPPFHETDAAETAALLARIRAASPDIVWVGLGSPKQEFWMQRHAASITGALCMGVGAAFDLEAGTVKRAPAWVQQLGLEWCFRVLQEPHRLAGRYAQTVPRFLLALAMEAVRARPRAGAAPDSRSPADKQRSRT
jgi:N-acetylglucosaminyldiphosphoundecaprenol N-acetyl-beta-D-mannosaminyltransferase